MDPNVNLMRIMWQTSTGKGPNQVEDISLDVTAANLGQVRMDPNIAQ